MGKLLSRFGDGSQRGFWMNNDCEDYGIIGGMWFFAVFEPS